MYIKIDIDNHQEALVWCRKNLGKQVIFPRGVGLTDVIWAADEFYETGMFFIKEESDALAFSLKWGGVQTNPGLR